MFLLHDFRNGFGLLLIQLHFMLLLVILCRQRICLCLNFSCALITLPNLHHSRNIISAIHKRNDFVLPSDRFLDTHPHGLPLFCQVCNGVFIRFKNGVQGLRFTCAFGNMPRYVSEGIQGAIDEPFLLLFVFQSLLLRFQTAVKFILHALNGAAQPRLQFSLFARHAKDLH